MDLLIILLIAALFILPTVVLRRKQNQQREEIEAMQASLTPGTRVVAAAGLHGTVASVTDTTVDLVVAPGVTVTYDKALIARVVEDPSMPSPIPPAQQNNAGQAGHDGPLPDQTQGYRLAGEDNPGEDHPENRS